MKVWALLCGWREEAFEYDSWADDILIGIYSTKEKAEKAMFDELEIREQLVTALIREGKCFDDNDRHGSFYEYIEDEVHIDSGELETWYKVEEVEIDKERSSK